MPTKDKSIISELLCNDRVTMAKEDGQMVNMSDLPKLKDKNVPNLHVMKATWSLKSQSY